MAAGGSGDPEMVGSGRPRLWTVVRDGSGRYRVVGRRGGERGWWLSSGGIEVGNNGVGSRG